MYFDAKSLISKAFRNGIDIGVNEALQVGFDNGYQIGLLIGRDWGRLLGILRFYVSSFCCSNLF